MGSNIVRVPAMAVVFTTAIMLGLIGCSEQPAAGEPSASTAAATSPAGSVLPLEIVSVTSPVKPGREVSITARTAPGARCVFSLWHEQSGMGKTADAPVKIADAEGWVSWTFVMYPDATKGAWRLIVKADLDGTRVERDHAEGGVRQAARRAWQAARDYTLISHRWRLSQWLVELKWRAVGWRWWWG